MKIIILAFLVSIALHLLVFESYKHKELTENEKKEEITEKKTDVKFVKLKQKENIQEQKIETFVEEVKKPVIEKKVEQKQVQNSKPIIEKKTEQKKVVDIEKSKNFQKEVLKEQIVREENSIQNKTLENFLSQKEPINREILNELEKLYGEEYNTFTKVQKAYLEKNFNNFQVITQRVLDRLGYPKLAAKLKISGVNIVEFMFNPDGSINGLKIIKSSGYAVLMIIQLN